ncbi:MAG: hypothetical protein IID18_06155 [Nitrospinae bacterium]|nr:hypothetical protein [Nitrospinota bacterium]
MISDRYFKIVLTLIAVALWTTSVKLWFAPQDAVADDIDTKNRLSYISKIVSSMESDLIKIQGDVRIIKRKVEVVKETKEFFEKRMGNLESQVTSIRQSVNLMEMDMASMEGNIAYLENDTDDLVSGTCGNIFLCRQKKF